MKSKFKKNIVQRIHARVNKSIPLSTIDSAVTVIINQIIEDLRNNYVVTVKGFGTLSPYLQKYRQLRYRTVKLHMHEFFRELVAMRRDRFLKKPVSKKK